MNQYLTAQELLGKAFDVSGKPLEGFNKHSYHGVFESYYGKMLPAFDAIEQLYLSVGDPDAMISNMAQTVVDRAKEAVDALPRRTAKDNLKMSLNMQLAVFIYPAILHYKGKSSKPLVDAISVRYKEAFPKSNVQAAEVEFIEKGFRRKFCYITTAVCESQGKADDCYELTVLRNYRDGYLASQENGEEMIEEYYDLAPTIVKHINAMENSAQIYQEIYETYLQPCIRMIEEGRNSECADKYMAMVLEMKERYFPVPVM